ncbi:SusC/RagA family TonB-linked outer membrane protein [Spirosoma endbachense]|uniref:SusC/RagA family TonB-linked outer membrane protein n=1 Tax=Spirosoma endbachense TaxID=2666025 RepID=A0A6P1W7H9_9BACT|nr:TonB-dependent receptor [Spirosoma endbachense]QHW00333.1 SusC/RagA family TonB-linked outer membrane protein [Spirosoma endbachense]
MKKQLYSSWRVFAVLLLSSSGACAGFAQPAFAFTNQRSITDKQAVAIGSQMVRLKDALKALKEHYKVDIIYGDQSIDLLSVSADEVKFQQSLEKSLSNLLRSSGLTYKKLKDGTYLILSKSQKGGVSEARFPEASGSITSQFVQKTVEDTRTKPDVVINNTQQDITVRGRVMDSDKGEILPGVSVVLKNSQKGTTTDGDGNYSMAVPDAGAVLVFSFVGYLPLEVTVGSRTTLNISLKPDTKSLSEVLVIGYGSQSRKTISTAITKVEGKSIANQPVGTPGEALAGLSSGVQVQSGRGGFPGEAPTIRIRGIGSLGTNSNPLYVVDGYPLQEPSQFNLINPSDIESIEILKDAASAAIYGSRAGNGVVIVTTKRGKAGKTAFSFSAYTGMQQIAKKVDVLQRDDYIEYIKYVARVTNQAYPSVFDTNPKSLPDTDWQDAIFRQAPISEYQLSASGGSDKVRYAVSGAYFSQQGTMKGTSYDRYNLRFNLDADLSPKLRIGVSLAPSYSQQYRQPAGGPYNNASSSELSGGRSLPNTVTSATLMPPIVPLYTANGDFGQNFDAVMNNDGSSFVADNLFSPLAIVELNKNRVRNYRLFGSGFLEYEPIKDVRIKSSLGSTLNLEDQYAYVPSTLANQLAPRANATNPVLGQIFARETQQLGLDWLWENTATYSKTLGRDHHFSVLALYSLQKFASKFTATSGRTGTFTTDLLPNPLASPDRIGELQYDQNAFLSYGGRLTYDYKSKYILSAALRRDASSRFGPNNRFATFPSFSAAWRLSEEPFIQAIKSTVNELKIRASFGETGNANIGSFNWVNSIVGRNYSFGGQRTFGAAQSGFANYDLTWERNQQTDLGLEVGFLNDKFSLAIDVYNRITKGMLFQKDLPGIVGYANTFRTNLGKLQNRGIEISGKANLKLGPVAWTIDANLSANRTNVLDLGGPQSLPPQAAVGGWNNVFQIKVGDPLGYMYGYKVQGIFKTVDDLTKYPQWVSGNKVGDWIIKDQNGDGKVDETDKTVIGKGLPNFIYGLTNTFRYQGFDLSVLIQGVQGANLINGNIRHPAGNVDYGSLKLFYQNMFDPANPNQDAQFHMAGAGGVTMGNNLTDRVVFSGSFLRIRNVTLGYTIPTAVLKRIKLQSARVFSTGQNLFTFTKYPWYNPEASLNGDSAYQPGVDQGTYPANRTVTVGLNIGF